VFSMCEHFSKLLTRHGSCLAFGLSKCPPDITCAKGTATSSGGVRRRGFMDITSVRPLSPVIDDATRAELDDLMHALDIDGSDL